MRAKTITLICMAIMTAGSLTVSPYCRAADYHLVSLDYPPMVFKDQTGTAKGAAVEIVTDIMADLGHSVTIDVLPWTRAIKSVQFGKADAIFTIFKNAEREMFLDYCEQILIPQLVAFYAHQGSRIVYSGDLEALRPLKIGVVSTISYGRKFDRARSYLNVERTASLEQNFSKMLMGRINLIVSNVYSAEIVINKLRIVNKIVRLEPAIESVPSYIAFSKMRKLTRLRDDFDRKLMELKQNGSYLDRLKNAGILIETGHGEK